MFKLFRKNHLLSLLALLSLNTMNPLESCESYECCDSYECNKIYFGAFGGGIFSNSNGMYQMGTAFFPVPLAVYTRGHAKKTSSGLGGVQIGYEWAVSPISIGCSEWSIAPAVELEGYWYNHKKKGHLISSTTLLDEHEFVDSFQMKMGVYLANAVISFKSDCLAGFSPYVGGGIGATHISVKNAKSAQIAPVETGINHFNSKTSDTSWAFAAQVKAGLRYNIFESLQIFGEYRYLFVDSSNYIFGSTVYPTHVPTSPWNVKVKNIHYNAFVVGLRYDL